MITGTKVEVTQKDIEAAPKYSTGEFDIGSCPVARASKRALGRTDCTVGFSRLCVNRKLYDLPQEAIEQIRLFCGDNMTPFSFRIGEEFVPKRQTE